MIVVDVEATTAMRQAELTAANGMIERTIDRFDLYPARLAGDSAYGSAEMLHWLVYEHESEPHVTVFDNPRAATARSHERTSPTMGRTGICGLSKRPARQVEPGTDSHGRMDQPDDWLAVIRLTFS